MHTTFKTIQYIMTRVEKFEVKSVSDMQHQDRVCMCVCLRASGTNGTSNNFTHQMKSQYFFILLNSNNIINLHYDKKSQSELYQNILAKRYTVLLYTLIRMYIRCIQNTKTVNADCNRNNCATA